MVNAVKATVSQEAVLESGVVTNQSLSLSQAVALSAYAPPQSPFAYVEQDMALAATSGGTLEMPLPRLAKML